MNIFELNRRAGKAGDLVSATEPQCGSGPGYREVKNMAMRTTKVWSAPIFLLIFLGAWLLTNIAHAYTVTASPTTCVDVATVGTLTWSNPTRAYASDNSYATAATNATGTLLTHYLKCTGYGFNIPTGATINGITVSVERKISSTSSTSAKDNIVQLLQAGSLVGSNLAATTTAYTTADVIAAHGSATNLWGATWTAADINNANFGVSYSGSITKTSGGGTRTLSIDQIQITVDFSLATWPAGTYYFDANPTNCVDDTVTVVGTRAWTNPTRAYVSDNSYATAVATSATGTQLTHYLKCTGYGFNIPTGATINGITVSVERKISSTSSTSGKDNIVQLLKAGSLVGSNLATPTAYTTADVVEAHGSPTNLWGTTWTVADIIDANFGVSYSGNITKTSTSSNRTISIDSMPIRVTFTIAAATPNHIRIEHHGGACSGTTAPAQITLKACADAAPSCTPYIATDVTGISISPTGAGYTLVPANTQKILAASGGINSGITLARSTAGTATLSLSGTITPAPSNAYECFNSNSGVSGDCNLVFGTDSLTFDTPDHTAGPRQIVTLTSCKATFASTARSVNFWSTFINPVTGSTGKIVAGTGNADCTTGYSNLTSTSTALSLAFGTGTSPQATFSLCYPDVGQVQVDARYDGSAGTGDAGTVILGNDRFIAAPHHFTLSNITCGNGTTYVGCSVTSPYANPAATSAAGLAFMKAGNPFSMTVTAYNTNGVVTPNFGKETTPEGISLAPTMITDADLTTPGTLSGTFGAFTSGVASSNAFSFGEVGIMTLIAKLASTSYLGSGLKEVTTPSSGNIGRFIPDHFTITADLNSPILTQADLTQNTATATGTTAPATVIDVDDSTGFYVGSKLRIPGAGAGGAAFTATVTAVSLLTLTLDTAIGTDLSAGDIVISEWGSYMGEPFNAQFTLTAVNLGNTPTKNYQGAYAKLNPAIVGALGFGAVNVGTNLTARLNTATSPTTSPTAGFTSGVVGISAPLAITRPVTSTPDATWGPYAALNVGIKPADSDGVVATSTNTLNFTAGGNNYVSIMDAIVQASTEVRFGRLKVLNTYGSELLRSRVEYRAEYWDGNRWTTNTADTGSGIAANNVAIPTGGPAVYGTPTFSNGVGFITFNTAAVGSYDIAINLGATGTANVHSCNATNPPTTAANLPWLQGYWSGSCSTPAWSQDPNARIKLGSPKAPYIYLRERY